METGAVDNWPGALEDFEPDELVASGRLSRVVRATDRSSGREVAVKILHDHLADEQLVCRRLRREFRAVRRLDHPAIVDVHQLIEREGCVALVMDWVDGPSVRERVDRQGPVDWSEARAVLDDVLAGLQHAHDRGIWHRDLSAEHVLIDGEGRGRIIGFGLAKVDELAAQTMHTQVLGAVEAKAPERVLGMDYDGRADLYSVGAVAHELLVGHPPAEGTMQSAFSRAEGDLEPVAELPDGLPEAARYLLERSLVADVSARFATAEQMRRAIEGSVDRRMFGRWTGRETDRCPGCETPVIGALDQCVECGHRFERLVRQPGQGQWMIEVISPDEAAGPDGWFDEGSDPDYLPRESFDALMEMLEGHADTRRVVDWTLEYRWPPYILVEHLTRSDADRISKKLALRGIPHRIRDESRSRLRRFVARVGNETGVADVVTSALGDSPEGGSEDAGQTGRMSRRRAGTLSGGRASKARDRPWTQKEKFVFWGVFPLLAPFIVTIHLVKQNLAFVTLAFVVIVPLVVVGSYSMGLSARQLGMSAGLFFAAMVGLRGGAGVLKRLFSTRRDRPRVGGMPLMLTAEALERIEVPDGGMQMPPQTGSRLRSIDDDSVRGEVHEMLVLAAVVDRSTEADEERLASLVDDALELGERIDEAVGRAERDSGAELYGRLERIESRLDGADEDERRELEQQRQTLVERLDAHDEAVHRVTVLRSALQKVRGVMLDMLVDSDREDLEEEIVLSFDDRLDELVTDMEVEVEAAREVDRLV